MLLTGSMILISMVIIGVIDYFVAVPIFNFDVWYVVLAVVINVAMVIVVDIIFATIVRWILPKKWFSIEKTFFSASKKTARFYEKIGIKKWKDKVLELGKVTGFRKDKLGDATSNEYVERFIVEANYGIGVHIACMIFGFLIIFIYPLEYCLAFGIPVGIVNVIINYMSYAILRYNLPKLHTLFKFNKRKEERRIKAQQINDMENQAEQ